MGNQKPWAPYICAQCGWRGARPGVWWVVVARLREGAVVDQWERWCRRCQAAVAGWDAGVRLPFRGSRG